MERSVEGTWDEIKLHEAEFAGRHLCVIIGVEQGDEQVAVHQRLRAWNDFVLNGVKGVVVDDSRDAIYGQDADRG